LFYVEKLVLIDAIVYIERFDEHTS